MHLVPRFRHVGLAGLIAAALAAPTVALSQAPSAFSTAEQLFRSSLYAGMLFDSYVERLRSEFHALDADGDGKITQRDVDLHVLMETIQMRTVSWTTIMHYDL